MKLFNCLLAAIISINVISVSAFAQTNDIETISPERNMAINVLKELEIVSNYSDEQGLKREEFALMVAKLLNFEDSEDLRKVYFTDVPIDNRFSGAIAFLVDKGAISVSADRKFYPKGNVTLVQVYKVLFHLMGYGDYITLARGGYPSGYLNTADDFKIDVSVKDVNNLSQNEVCEIIYKFGNLGLCTPEMYYGGGNVTLSVDSENTLLSVYHSLYVSRGVLTNTFTNALNHTDIDENEVIIDSNKYYCTLENVDEYFADYIEFAYFKEENSPYDGAIASMYAVEGKKYNIDKTFDSDYIVGFDSNTYTLKYENEAGRLKSEKIKTDIEVVYNGSPVTGMIENYINEFVTGNKKGYVHLKGYNNNDYSYMIIESFDSCVIGQLDATKETIFDKNNNYNIFTMEDYSGVLLMNHKLEKIAFSELTLSSIIEVAESKDKRFLKVIQCSTDPEFIVKGKIKGINDENEIELEDGSVYEVDGYFWDYYEKNLSFSTVYTFYLDYFGDIAYAEIMTEDGYKIGYLVNGKYDSFELVGWLKIYDSTGVMEKFNLAEKTRVDKVRYKTSLHAMAAIPGTTGIVDLQSIENENNKPIFEQQVIRYKLNVDGEICEIDTRRVGDNEDEGNTLTKREKITDSRQQYAVGSNNNYRRLGKDVLVDKTKTMVFSVPLVDEQGYCIVWDERLANSTKSRLTDLNGNYVVPNDSMYKMNPIRHDTRFYQFDCYNYDSNTLYSDILVIHSDTMPDYLNPIMVGKRKMALNIDDEVIIEMECYDGQSKKSLYFPQDFDFTGINNGDIIRAYTDNSTGLIGKIQKVFDRETMLFVNGTGNAEPYLQGDLNATTDGYSNGWQLSKGYSLRHEGDVIQLSYDYPRNKYDYDEIATINQKVVIYDGDGDEEIHIGTGDEIVDYVYAGSDCSTVIIHSRNVGIWGATFVYK